ncbi:MAG: sulfatase-like hydrolase/transferase [Candidatus Hydrogenedentes bacterium]|nr:sulfatase-like hydrolase/transferase [Candidatus Hydrogenedentota bacterium]
MFSIGRRGFLAAGGAGLATALLSVRGHAVESRRPNIVVILVDDLRPDGLAALGNPVVKTPHFDSLVTNGCAFRRAYTMGSMVGAVCLPSRTMLLTGRSLFRAEDKASGVEPASYTFPRAMKEAGYATLHAGKFGNSPKRITDEFDETYDPGNATQVVDKVTDFIRRTASRGPMCVYMAGHEPHDPQYAPEEFYARYRAMDIPLPRAFAPFHPFDNGEMTVRDEMTLPFPRTPEDIRGKLARYYASISYLDTELGRVIQTLKDTKQFDNTYFVIAGDNGLSLGEHGLLGKQNLYEYGGMHVPLVISGPGISRRESNALVYLMDVFPTVCDLARASIPAQVEGLSLASIVHGRARRVRTRLFTAYGKVQRAVSDGRWKLIRYPRIHKNQIFDLEADPHEMNDLSEQPGYAKRVDAMLKELSELQSEFGDPVPLHVPNPGPADWSPGLLTPEQLRYQAEETARCAGTGT